MWSSLAVGIGVTSLLVCFGSEVHACDASGWMVLDNEGPCTRLSPQGDGTYRITNTCDESVILTEFDCMAVCAADLELAGGATTVLKLPAGARDGQIASFHYVRLDEESTLRFEYSGNTCTDYDGGCSVACPSHGSYAAPELVLLALGLASWSRRARGKCAEHPYRT